MGHRLCRWVRGDSCRASQYVSDTFDWPRQIQQFGTLALLFGLPIALVIAWYHGDRGQQRLSAP